MKPFLLSCIIVLGPLTAFSQGKNNSLEGVPAKERIVTGGGLGLSFGNTMDFISVSPIIGYAITKKFIAGTGLTYRYTKYKTINPPITFNDYAFNPFARFTVYNGIFIQTEFEHLNYEYYVGFGETARSTFNSFLAGGGFIQPMGRNAAFFVMALYNFSYTASSSLYTPYQSPWVIRAGITIGGISF
ncbi:MAG: hypothetical protein HRU69_01430 [Flammeovirgaceae bacterium]|nr:MAG: hypothetical protein HRU69_01430 [Flammeovirgaceae bacterium]